MSAAKSTGRTLGILLLLQLVAGLTVPFMLMHPLNAGTPGFLTAAAEHAAQLRAAVLLAFAGGTLTASLGITAMPVFRQYSNAAALTFMAACLISCTLDAVHNATVMTMLSVSQAYASGGEAEPGLYQALGLAVASARRWAHYTQLVAIGAWIFVLYCSLLRFALIPRALAALGLLGIVLQFAGVTLLTFLGYGSVSVLAMPMGPIQLAVAVWLIVKGFNVQADPVSGEVHGTSLAGA